jgi:autophagy-related protein 2
MHATVVIDPLEDPLLVNTAALADALAEADTIESPFPLYPSMATPIAPTTPLTQDGVVKMRRKFTVKESHFSRTPTRDATELEPFFPQSQFKITIDGASWTLCLEPGLHFADQQPQQSGTPFGVGADAPGRTSPHGRTSPPGSPYTNEALVVKVDGLRVVYDEFSPLSDYASRVVLLVHQLDVLDRMADSQINKFLTDFKTDSFPRESTAEMLRVDIVTVRTPQTPQVAMADSQETQPEELIVRVQLLPLRLNLDQDALNFLIKFLCYSEDKAAAGAEDGTTDRTGVDGPGGGADENGAADDTAPKGPYFKLFVIAPLSAQVDTVGKHLKVKDILAGKYEELFGLMSLDKANLVLPNVVVKAVTGAPRLAQEIALQYATHVKNTQIPGIVGGVPLVRPVVNLAQAAVKGALEPLTQFPWVFHGLYDGITATAQSGTVEFCNVATALTFALQASLELAHGVVSKDDAVLLRRTARSRFAQQPVDAHDGFQNARDALFGAVHEAYNEVVQRPQMASSGGGSRNNGRGIRGMHQASPAGAGQGSVMIRMIGAAPGAGLRPLIGLCEAVSLSLQGIRNGVDPDVRRDLNDKYRA